MRLLAGLAGIALALTACKSGDGLGIDIKIHQESLPNGLKVLMLEDHTAPVVSFQTWVGVGSIDEKPGATGLAHLFEHLMFKGTEKFGSGTFFRELEEKGARINAFTTRDYTVFYEILPPELLPKAIEMEADRLRNLKLNQALLDGERRVVLEERRQRMENSPEGKIEEVIWALAYREHPYRWPVIGSMTDLLNANLEGISAFYNTYYQPSNTTLVFSGDIQRKQVMSWVKTHYGPLKKTRKPHRHIPKEEKQFGERRLIVHDEVTSERLARAYHIPAAGEDDAYALDVLANILFSGRSSRAYKRLVEEKKILLGVSGTAFTPAHPGLFMISGVLRGNLTAEHAEAELDRLISELHSVDPVTQDDVDAAVRQLLVQQLGSIRTAHGLGQFVGTVNAILGDPYRFADEALRYSRVKPSDVMRASATYLQPNNRSVVIVRRETK